MASPVLTRYAVEELVQTRKVAGKTTTQNLHEVLLFGVRRVDSPLVELKLVFEARNPPSPPPGVPSVRRPSASLLWHRQRIRGIDWTIKHEVTRNGVPTGEVIRNWHEHYWTEEDGSKSIRIPNPIPRNEDRSSLITWCCKQWNIEGIPEPTRLFK